ncbi:Uncharacterised protein [Cedecea neteri]|uniref:Uncharacterized protein n=1 Tax=Cedecea neteri TaxID=158822 RepID=A0A2X3KX76_9ENTR|nr:Uncharacterised protein [Cedecea neteri]
MYYSESKRQNVSGSPEYHIHIALSTDKHLDNSNPVQQMSFFANDPDWVKKRFIFIAPESREYCISFQGKYDNSGIDRGAIITQINAYVGDEDDGSDPNKFRVISAVKELPLTQEENETNLNNHALHFTLQQQFGDDWKVPQARHQLRFDLTDGDNIIFDNDSLHYKITPSDEGKFTLPANCIKAKLVTADITKYMTVGLVGTDNSFKQIKKVGYSDFGFQNYVESKLPLRLKASASDKWTVDGTVPKSITEQQKISLQLKKNGKSLNAAEKLTIVLDPVGNLSVDSTTITTDDDGKFTITLTPNSGQSEHHITSLMLKLGENTVATYKIETGAAPAAKYDIKVYKDSDGKNPIDLNTVNTWTANTGHYVYVSVVKHGTSERVDTASINIAASPTTALVPLTSPVKIENGTPARVAFKPGTSASGNATITFSTTIDGQECLADLKVYLGESGSLEVVTPTPITLSPGIERTPSGDLAVLDVRFNPQVSGTVPEISFRVDGDDLTVLSEENIFVTDGVLKPADPKGNGDYRILPVLKTDKNASGPAKITFFIDKLKYQQEAAKWKQVTVTVNISSVDHVKWSVASGALVDTGSNPTVLKTGLKAYDSNGKEMSSYVMDVHIVTDDVDATFVDNTLTHRLTGPDSTGWARLPEMIVGQKTGKIHLQASAAGRRRISERGTASERDGSSKTERHSHPSEGCLPH